MTLEIGTQQHVMSKSCFRNRNAMAASPAGSVVIPLLSIKAEMAKMDEYLKGHELLVCYSQQAKAILCYNTIGG